MVCLQKRVLIGTGGYSRKAAFSFLAWYEFILPERLTFFNDVLKVRHALNIRSGNIFVLPKDGPNLGTELLQHMWISYKKTAMFSVLAAISAIQQYSHLQYIRHCCRGGISACNQNIDDLISNQTYISMLVLEIVYECVPIGIVCGIVILL